MRTVARFASAVALAVGCLTAGAAVDTVLPASARNLPPELRHVDVEVRLRAIPPLIRDGDREALGLLSAAALFDPHWTVRREAILALGEIGKPLALPTLEQSFLDPDRRAREAAIEAIREIGGDQAALSLRFALIDEDALLREDAMVALGEIGGPIAIAILEHGLGDEHASVREIAAEVLEDLDPGRLDPVPGSDKPLR